jgi:hypothetical protein
MAQELSEAADGLSITQIGDRFLFYSRRVQALHFDCADKDDSDRRVSFFIIAWWGELNSRHKIFPKLREVDAHAHEDYPVDVQTVLAFVPPSLVTLELDLSEGLLREHGTPLVIPPQLLCLRTLRILQDSYEVRCGTLLKVLVHSAPNLRKIMVAGHISADEMLPLSRLADLRELSIEMLDKDPYPNSQRLVDVFQQLRRWDISEIGVWPHFHLLHFFLAVAPNTQLKMFIYRLHELSLPRATFDVFIGDLARWTSLVNLRLDVCIVGDTVPMSDTDALLQRFYPLVRLETLHLRTNIYTSLDKDCIDRMLRACPDLKEWRFRIKPAGRRRGYASSKGCNASIPFSDFLGLIRTRPQVVVLPITVRCDALPLSDSTLSVAHPSYWDLEVHAVHDPAELAELVQALLPQVKRVTAGFTGTDPIPGDAAKVRQVNNLLPSPVVPTIYPCV